MTVAVGVGLAAGELRTDVHSVGKAVAIDVVGRIGAAAFTGFGRALVARVADAIPVTVGL